MRRLLLACCLFVIAAVSVAAEIDDLRSERGERRAKIERLKANMFLYALDHKLATAALIAAGGGLAAYLRENMDADTRKVVMAVGVVGLLYCVNGGENAEECATAAATLGDYAAKIGVHEKAVATIETRIASLAAPTSAFGAMATNAPVVVGSNAKGPFYNAQLPDGVFAVKDVEVKLILSAESNVSRSLAKLDVANFKRHAEQADSRLHNTSDGFSYLLLDKDTLVVFKHVSTYRDYAKPAASLVGIGADLVRRQNGLTQVAYLVRGSPAQTAGLRKDDYVLAVGGVGAKTLSLEALVERIRGTAGTDVQLMLSRAATPETPYFATVRRSVIHPPTIASVNGYVGIYRATDGRYYYFRNDRDTFGELSLGEPLTLTWPLDTAGVTMKFVRPTRNADPSDREVDYAFSVN